MDSARASPFLTVATLVVTFFAAIGCGDNGPPAARPEALIEPGEEEVLRLADGASVRFLPDSLDRPTDASLAVLDEPTRTVDGYDGALAVGETYRIDLSGVDLAGDIEITLPYNPDALPAGTSEDEDVFLAYFDEELNSWVPVSGTVDAAANTITVRVRFWEHSWS